MKTVEAPITDKLRQFFQEDAAGVEALRQLHAKIEAEHKQAEATDEPLACFAHTQRAKGIREAINHLNTMSTKAKKGRTV